MSIGSTVSIRANELADGQIELEITNTGSSIDEDKLSNIFDSFYTFGKKSGTGLGLAISKKFIEAHGGKISCLSSKKMDQVSFYMSLPLAKSSEAKTVTEKFFGSDFVAGKKTEEGINKIKDKELIALSEQIKLKATGERKYNILIADDEEIYLETVSGILKTYGLDKYFDIDFETSARRHRGS